METLKWQYVVFPFKIVSLTEMFNLRKITICGWYFLRPNSENHFSLTLFCRQTEHSFIRTEKDRF